LLASAWAYRSNMTVSDALYVVLTVRLSASLLTDDGRLANAPTFPSSVRKLMLP
jgi:predicted nucleic acid-binding protein